MRLITLLLLLSFQWCVRTGNAQNINSERVFSSCAPGVVFIETPMGLGSGFYVNNEGWIVTNKHVIEYYPGQSYSASQITVRTKEGRLLYVEQVQFAYHFSNVDIALLKTRRVDLPVLPISVTRPSIGSEIVIIGHPRGLRWTQTRGTVTNSQYEDGFRPEQHIITDAATNPGNSGGPVINKYGVVVGVVQGVRRDMALTGLAVSSTQLATVLDSYGITYSTVPLLKDLMSENERQFYQLASERRKLDTELARLDSLKREFDIARETVQTELFQRRIELQDSAVALTLRIESAKQLLNEADALRAEFAATKERLEEREEAVKERELALDDNLRQLRSDEQELHSKLARRFGFNVDAGARYVRGISQDTEGAVAGFSLGLCYKFGFTRSHSGYPIDSDRFGVYWSVYDQYSPISDEFYGTLGTDIGAGFEFDDTFRILVGASASDHAPLTGGANLFTELSLNTNGYPVPIRFVARAYKRSTTDLFVATLGLSVGYEFSFLKW